MPIVSTVSTTTSLPPLFRVTHRLAGYRVTVPGRPPMRSYRRHKPVIYLSLQQGSKVWLAGRNGWRMSLETHAQMNQWCTRTLDSAQEVVLT
jgi:hypothetical protein